MINRGLKMLFSGALWWINLGLKKLTDEGRCTAAPPDRNTSINEDVKMGKIWNL